MSVTPGFLNQQDAAAINAAIVDTATTKTTLQRLAIDAPIEIFAKLTAWDASTQRATWVQQQIDSDGQRIDLSPGLFGDQNYNPAVPVGNGILPPPIFPIQTVLRRRGRGVVAGIDIGDVWEFPWACACAGSGSGSGGSGGSGILVPCCPSALPQTLTVTLMANGACATGSSGTLTFNGVDSWTGLVTDAVKTWAYTFKCQASVWTGTASADAGICTGSLVNDGTGSCVPFMQTFNFFAAPSGCGTCDSQTLTFVVTE